MSIRRIHQCDCCNNEYKTDTPGIFGAGWVHVHPAPATQNEPQLHFCPYCAQQYTLRDLIEMAGFRQPKLPRRNYKDTPARTTTTQAEKGRVTMDPVQHFLLGLARRVPLVPRHLHHRSPAHASQTER